MDFTYRNLTTYTDEDGNEFTTEFDLMEAGYSIWSPPPRPRDPVARQLNQANPQDGSTPPPNSPRSVADLT